MTTHAATADYTMQQRTVANLRARLSRHLPQVLRASALRVPYLYPLPIADDLQDDLREAMIADARAAGHQPRRPKPISRSDKARRMIAEGADATAVERATGLSRVTVRALFNGECASTGLKHGGSRISPMGLKARAMIAGGATAREVREATGMSERQAHKLIRRARMEAAA